jgi:hypothetical protein
MKTSLLQIRLTDEEKIKITDIASQSSFRTVSGYVRARALNEFVESRFDKDFIFELIKINADISRLGNLLRLSLKDNNKYNAEQLRLIEEHLLVTTKKLKEMVLSDR